MSTTKKTLLEKNQEQQASRKHKYKVAQKLTVPLFSVAHKLFMIVQITGEMYEADMKLGDFKDGDDKPTVVPCIDLDTDEAGLLICNEIIKSSFKKVQGGYVDKVFTLRAGEIADGKRYRRIDIDLMEEE